MNNIIKALLITVLIVGIIVGITYLESKYLIVFIATGVIGCICFIVMLFSFIYSMLKESEEE